MGQISHDVQIGSVQVHISLLFPVIGTVAVVVVTSVRNQKRRRFVLDLVIVVFPSVMMVSIVRVIFFGMIVRVTFVGTRTTGITMVRLMPMGVVILFVAMFITVVVSFVVSMASLALAVAVTVSSVVILAVTTLSVIVSIVVAMTTLSVIVFFVVAVATLAVIVSVIATATTGQVDVILSQDKGQGDVHHQADSRDSRHEPSVDGGAVGFVLVLESNQAVDGVVRQAEADDREARDAEEGRQRFGSFETVRVLLGGRKAGEMAGGDRHREGCQIRKEMRRIAQDRQGSRPKSSRDFHDEETRAQDRGGGELPDDVLSLGGIRRIFAHGDILPVALLIFTRR